VPGCVHTQGVGAGPIDREAQIADCENQPAPRGAHEWSDGHA